MTLYWFHCPTVIMMTHNRVSVKGSEEDKDITLKKMFSIENFLSYLFCSQYEAIGILERNMNFKKTWITIWYTKKIRYYTLKRNCPYPSCCLNHDYLERSWTVRFLTTTWDDTEKCYHRVSLAFFSEFAQVDMYVSGWRRENYLPLYDVRAKNEIATRRVPKCTFVHCFLRIIAASPRDSTCRLMHCSCSFPTSFATKARYKFLTLLPRTRTKRLLRPE